MKLRSMKFSRSFSLLRCGKVIAEDNNNNNNSNVSLQGCSTTLGGEVKWELRPGGMLVQKREIKGEDTEDKIMMIRVVTGSQWHDISIQDTSTFGELKLILSMVTGFEVNEQRLLFKGKEREDKDYLHMVGVKDKDKVLMLQDPAIKEKKLITHALVVPYRTVTL